MVSPDLKTDETLMDAFNAELGNVKFTQDGVDYYVDHTHLTLDNEDVYMVFTVDGTLVGRVFVNHNTESASSFIDEELTSMSYWETSEMSNVDIGSWIVAASQC